MIINDYLVFRKRFSIYIPKKCCTVLTITSTISISLFPTKTWNQRETFFNIPSEGAAGGNRHVNRNKNRCKNFKTQSIAFDYGGHRRNLFIFSATNQLNARKFDCHTFHLSSFHVPITFSSEPFRKFLKLIKLWMSDDVCKFFWVSNLKEKLQVKTFLFLHFIKWCIYSCSFVQIYKH